MSDMTDEGALDTLRDAVEWNWLDDDAPKDIKADILSAIDYIAARLREPAGVPEGWVLVPREPTLEMVEAGVMFGTSPNQAAIIFQNMVHAAPQPPAEAQRCTCPSGDGSLRWPCPAHPAEAQPVAKLVNRKDADGGKTTTFIRPTSLGMDLPLGEYPLHLHPSAPVGVEALRDARTIYDIACIRAEYANATREDVEFKAIALRNYNFLAQQPAADGGFSAADMMDARQEGRKEAQQPASVDEATRHDADRYRWLRDSQGRPGERYPYKVTVRLPTGYSHTNELDAAIDQARGKGGTGK